MKILRLKDQIKQKYAVVLLSIGLMLLIGSGILAAPLFILLFRFDQLAYATELITPLIQLTF